MRDKAFHFGKKVLTHELVSGSSILFLGTTLANFFAFLFNLFLVRNMSYGEYGEFSALISLITLITIPGQAIQPIIVQFASDYLAKKEADKATSFYYYSIKVISLFSFLLCLFFLLSASYIKSFLKITDLPALLLSGFVIFIIYIGIPNSSFLQSLLRFNFLSMTGVLGGALKLFFGILLVFLGFHVTGALSALVLSFTLPFLLTFIPLKSILRHKEKKAKLSLQEIGLYALPTIVTIFSLSSFTAADVLLVKHFFSLKDAGLYAGLSLMGRIIFYFTAPITTVMFPLVIKRFEEKRNYQNLFYVALALVLLPSAVITLFYFSFPHLAIQFFLGGKGYQALVPYIGYFGLFLLLFSLVNVLVNFFLSLRKTHVAALVFLGAVMQVVLITLFHNSFAQVISVSIVDMLVLFFILLLYYFKEYGFQKKHA